MHPNQNSGDCIVIHLHLSTLIFIIHEDKNSAVVRIFRYCFCSVLDSCNFDVGTLCDWTNDPSNPELPDGKRYDWQLQKGATPSKKTGPSGDQNANGQGKVEGLELRMTVNDD